MKYLYALLIGCMCIQVSAQEFPYTLNYLDEPYVSFDDGTDLVPEIWDNPYVNLPIGFEFEYFGVDIESFMLTGLGAMMSSTDDTFSTQSLFLPYSSDVIDAGQVTGEHTSVISYKTTGVEPERVFHVQWSDCALNGEVMDSNTASNRVSFQIRLYEGTNDIAIHYGPQTIEDNTLLHDGNPGPSIGFYANLNFATNTFEDYWIVGGSTTDPQPLWGNPDFYYDNSFNPLDDDPADGTLYFFHTSSVGIASVERSTIAVYPNPAVDALKIKVESGMIGAHYEVVNPAGQLVLQGQFEAGTQVLDVSTMESGLYFLRGCAGSEMFGERFVKE